ncbi:MAG: hypothetical protein JO340_08325 [Acidobacteriaceae bacterium]|nr:hypothetical protein [Acidobacteriaceae bacterium]
MWLNNPVYEDLAGTWPMGWVLEDSNDKIAGYIGNIPLYYELGGKRYLTATSRAWVVDAEHRSYSLLLLDYFFSQKAVDLYLTTSLNNEAFEGFQTFAPSRVPVGDWDRSRFWITNYSGFAFSWLKMNKVPFASALKYPLSAGMILKDILEGKRFQSSDKGHELRFCAGFDEGFDIFWNELKKRRRHVLLGERTRDVLQWHFKYALMRYEAWIVCSFKQSRLCAYSIFYRQDNTRLGLTRMRLADFQTLEDDHSLLLNMLLCVLDRCRKTGIHMLEIVGISRENAQVVDLAKPYRRKLGSWLSFYKTANSQLVSSLSDANTWDLSCFDGDTSL